MSSVKEYMHDLWSQRDVEVSFTCPHCKNISATWLKVSGDQGEHYEEVFCEYDEDEDAWTVIIHHDETGWSAELEKAPNVDVTIKVDDTYDDYEEPEPEPDAYGIFRRALADWRSNVRELGTPFGASSRNRMLFVTAYSILEAYLSDAIIGAAVEDVAVQKQMLKLDGLKGNPSSRTPISYGKWSRPRCRGCPSTISAPSTASANLVSGSQSCRATRMTAPW
ncbi:hypothetical protein [Rhizobium leguminosarum]